ncbi:Aspartyl protease family protein [Dichanthelium oligosanthes]|uniref:Aspartyl protease family protein n=1 Tax=Dichanthelium oligosanthes TaxID=888268 RepID=A0A1E5VSW7_9POAL|nr:Aspartyl protease family protein [Dichanthelium oligosanthes]
MIPVLPLLLVLCVSSPVANAKISSLKSNAVCSGHRADLPMLISVSIPLSSRTWLPLNHRRGPCSPFSSSETIPSTGDVLHRDRLRADSIRKGLNGTAAAKRGDVTVATTLGSSLGTLEYVVTVGLGTPAATQTVYMDTGSDVTWVQCRPCPAATCHPQKDPVFNPARSATYSAVRCGSAACKGLDRDRYGNGCSRRLCQYLVKYGDSSNTTGTYSADKLTLTPSYAVDHFQFGCSHAAHLFSDKADGLMGLGGGSRSLVSQTAMKAFSYCLPPTASYSGFLTLGVPRASSSRFVVTPMYRSSNVDTFYLVLLQGITVAGRRLNVPPSVFTARAVMDSGTIITRLPPKAYRALRAAFRKEMKMYPRVASSSTILDTCFNLSGVVGDVKVPSVALVFEKGATVELDPSGIIINDCLAFAPTGGDESVGIIGNVQQRTLEVLYDIGGGAVGFRGGAC